MPSYEFTYLTTDAGKEIAPVIDIPYHLTLAVCTESTIRLGLQKLKDLGFSRVYFVLCGAGHPMFSTPRIAMSLNNTYTYRKSVEVLGDPNEAFARICLELGMEPYAIYKPYEGGGGMSVPAGVTIAEGGYHYATVGGNRVFFDEFINEHPEMRVMRKPDYNEGDHTLPITRIEFDFIQGSFIDNSSRGGKSYSVTEINKSDVCVWVSRDNATYELYDKEFAFEYSIKARTVYDPNGKDLFEKEKRCLVLSITGLDITEEYQYVAVTFASKKNLYTIPYSMIRMYSGEKELKLTAGVYVRVLSEYSYRGEWSAQKLPESASSITDFNVTAEGKVTGSKGSDLSNAILFNQNGFEFNWYGQGGNTDGWISSNVYGIARGKQEYLSGGLCEAYPEVREFWLSEVRAALDAGYRGIDIRLQSHSCMITDPVNYGYNEPVAKRYRELYGADIYSEEADYSKLMQVRGEFFTLFLEEAEKLIHERGGILQIHLKAEHETAAVNALWNGLCNWTMPKIALDWKRCVELADEVTIKDYYYKNYSETAASGIKNYAAELGKRLWIHCYYTQGDEYDAKFLEALQADRRISGILIYDYVFGGPFVPDTKAMLKSLGYGE